MLLSEWLPLSVCYPGDNVAVRPSLTCCPVAVIPYRSAGLASLMRICYEHGLFIASHLLYQSGLPWCRSVTQSPPLLVYQTCLPSKAYAPVSCFVVDVDAQDD